MMPVAATHTFRGAVRGEALSSEEASPLLFSKSTRQKHNLSSSDSLVINPCMKLTCICLVVLALWSTSYADESSNAPSRENGRREAQGEATIVDVATLMSDIGNAIKGIAGFIVEAGVLADGSVQVVTGLQTSDQNWGTQPSAFSEITIESRVWSEPERPGLSEVDSSGRTRVYYSPGSTIQILPFEIRMRGDIKEDPNIQIEDIRVSVARALLAPGGAIGITAQVGSYIAKNYRNANARLDKAFEPVAMTLSSAVAITKDRFIEVVVKGYASAVLSGKLTSDAPAITAATQEAAWANPGQKYHAVGGTLNGSIGVRVKKTILIELFGGMQSVGIQSVFTSGTTGAPDYVRRESNLNFLHKYIGTNLRLMPNKNLHILASAKRELFDTGISYPEQGIDRNQVDTINSAFLTFEVRW